MTGSCVWPHLRLIDTGAVRPLQMLESCELKIIGPELPLFNSEMNSYCLIIDFPAPDSRCATLRLLDHIHSD